MYKPNEAQIKRLIALDNAMPDVMAALERLLKEYRHATGKLLDDDAVTNEANYAFKLIRSI